MQNRSSETLLESLQKQPSFEAFCDILNTLQDDNGNEDGNLRVGFPNFSSSKIIDQLIRINIPDFWDILYRSEDHVPELELLVACLRNVIALGSIYSRLRFLVSKAENRKKNRDDCNLEQNIVILLELLSVLLAKDDFANSIWNSCRERKGNTLKRQMMWKEFLNLIPSGKLIAIMSQAATFIKSSTESVSWNFISTGSNLAYWLGLNIVYMTRFTDADDNDKRKAITLFFGRSVTLGYSSELYYRLARHL